MASLDKLPTELIQQIAMDLDSPQDRVALSRVSKTLFVNVLPILYRHHTATFEAVKWAAERGRMDILEAAVQYSDHVAEMLNPLPPAWPYCGCLYPGSDDCPHTKPTDTLTYATPLHVAAHHGQDEAVKFLLAHGAAIHAMSLNYCSCKIKDHYGENDLYAWTPLHHAICGRHLSTAKLLFDHGATIEIGFPLHPRSSSGTNTWSVPCRLFPWRRFETYSSTEDRFCADPAEYITALHMAVAEGDLDTIKLIKERYKRQSRLGASAKRPVVVEEYILPNLPWGVSAETALDYLCLCNERKVVKRRIFRHLKSMGIESHLYFHYQGLEHKYQLESSSADHAEYLRPWRFETWEAAKANHEAYLIDWNSVERMQMEKSFEDERAKWREDHKEEIEREEREEMEEMEEMENEKREKEEEAKKQKERKSVARETPKPNGKEQEGEDQERPKRSSQRLKRKRENQEKEGDQSVTGKKKRRG